ncbi:MAG: Spy/CpxP family protein refolding chaperone [Burkholderiales bacterium]
MPSLRTLLVALVACATFGTATAQMGGPAGGGRPTGAGGPGGRSIADAVRNNEARMAGANYFDLVSLRISQLEEDLNLTPPQLPAWNTYKERLTRMLDDQRRGARVSASETTAPKQLDGLADIARNRLTAVEDIVDAGKALYAVLTPEQKVIADRKLVLPLATMTGNDAGTDVRRTPRAGDAGPPPK